MGCTVEDAYPEEDLAGWQVELLGEAEGGFGEAGYFVGLEGYVEGLGEDVEALAFGVVGCGVEADGGFVGSACVGYGDFVGVEDVLEVVADEGFVFDRGVGPPWAIAARNAASCGGGADLPFAVVWAGSLVVSIAV